MAQSSGSTQYARSVEDMSQQEKAFRFAKMFQKTNPQFVTTSDQAVQQLEAIKRQNMVTRGARANLTRLGPSLRFGLAGVAAGVWIHNGITLWNVGQCGNTDCTPLELDAQFRAATDRAEGGSGAAAGGTSKVMDYGGNIKATTVIDRVYLDYDVAGRKVTTQTTATVQKTDDWGSTSIAGYMTYDTVSGSGAVGAPSINFDWQTWGNGFTRTNYSDGWTEPLPQGTTQLYTMDWQQGVGTLNRRNLGPVITGWTDYQWVNPIYDWGVTEPGVLPSGTPHQATDAESDAFYSSVVADPEIDCPTPSETPDPVPGGEPEEPSGAPETCPTWFPPEWEEDDPNTQEDDDWRDLIEKIWGPNEVEYPNADPDQDGEPNKSDEDDDGDGEPDTTDPTPWTLPVEHPNADPDEDGEPNETDTDDDNDGIPDEYDPSPYVATPTTELPDEHEYADPDGDEIPNHEDEDDDGDGIPDEIDPRPYTPDTDTDGDDIPDEEDTDDDNDGIPDEYDPYPLDPTEPETLPDYHPYRDKDGDGTPNRTDLDDDGDGRDDWQELRPWTATPLTPEEGGDDDLDEVPNIDDPWPGNPYAPSRPSEDGDDDGVPDYGDPVPDDPSVPWDPTRTDQLPGNPTSPAPGDSPVSPRWPGDSPTRNPVTPSNPEYPGNSTRPTGPTAPDPTNPTHPKTPVDRAQPDDPAVPGTPDPTPTSACENPRQPSWEVPRLMIEDVFPFSLVIWAWGLMGALVGEPVAPVWDLGLLGTVDLGSGAFAAIVLAARTLIWVVAGIGMAVWFYSMIRSGSS